jgi:hypothetical protein
MAVDLKGASEALTHRCYDVDGFDFLIWQRGGTHQDDGLLLPAVKDDAAIIPPSYELLPPAVHDDGLFQSTADDMGTTIGGLMGF